MKIYSFTKLTDYLAFSSLDTTPSPNAVQVSIYSVALNDKLIAFPNGT